MDWEKWLDHFGVPIVALVALSIAVWRALVYIGANILKPLADRHIQFIDTLEKTQTGMLDKLTTQTQQLDDQTVLLKAIKATSTVQTKIMVEEHRAGDSAIIVPIPPPPQPPGK